MVNGNKPIKIFINASTVLISGGLILSLEIIESLVTSGNYYLVITCPKLKPYKHLQTNNSSLKVVPGWMLNKFLRWYHDYFWLPSAIKQEKPQLIITLANIPCVTSFPQIYLHDNPYVSEKNLGNIPLSAKERAIHALRNKITLHRMKYVDLLLVQTKYQKKCMLENLPGEIPVKILPPCIPHTKRSSFNFSLQGQPSDKNLYTILCPTRYYEHKNLEILFTLAKRIKERGLPIRIFLTVSTAHGKKAKRLIKNIEQSGLREVLTNLGQVYHRNMPELYKNADAIILPSLLESFSISCVEAWYYKKPLMVSDIETFRSACFNAAQYFKPLDADDILRAILVLRQDTNKQTQLIQNGLLRLKDIETNSSIIPIIEEFQAEKIAPCR